MGCGPLPPGCPVKRSLVEILVHPAKVIVTVEVFPQRLTILLPEHLAARGLERQVRHRLGHDKDAEAFEVPVSNSAKKLPLGVRIGVIGTHVSVSVFFTTDTAVKLCRGLSE